MICYKNLGWGRRLLYLIACMVYVSVLLNCNSGLLYVCTYERWVREFQSRLIKQFLRVHVSNIEVLWYPVRL